MWSFIAYCSALAVELLFYFSGLFLVDVTKLQTAIEAKVVESIVQFIGHIFAYICIKRLDTKGAYAIWPFAAIMAFIGVANDIHVAFGDKTVEPAHSILGIIAALALPIIPAFIVIGAPKKTTIEQ